MTSFADEENPRWYDDFRCIPYRGNLFDTKYPAESRQYSGNSERLSYHLDGSRHGGWRFASSIASGFLVGEDKKFPKPPLTRIRISGAGEDRKIAQGGASRRNIDDPSASPSSFGPMISSPMISSVCSSDTIDFYTRSRHFEYIILRIRPAVFIFDDRAVRDISLRRPNNRQSAFNSTESGFNHAQM